MHGLTSYFQTSVGGAARVRTKKKKVNTEHFDPQNNVHFITFLRVLERNSPNPLDLLVLERKRVSVIKEKTLTPV